MNKLLIISGALMIASLPGMRAQEDKPDKPFDREAFLLKRNAFISTELELTSQEADLFLPLLDELQRKKFEAGQTCRKLSKELDRKDNPTDAEYLETIDECLTVGLKEAELEKEYYEKFKKVLPPEKLYKYKEVEYRFAREFVNSSRRKPGPPPPGPGGRERR